MTTYSPCLLIPVYNHAEHFERLAAKLDALQLPCIVVDDGSEPRHAAILDQLVDKYAWIDLLRLPENRGKGAAFVEGVRRAATKGFTHALQLDADGQHDTADIPDMLALSRRHPDAIVSGRPIYDASAPRSRVWGRYITHVWVWVETLSLEIKDSMCGFRVYPVEACCQLAAKQAIARRMDFDTDIMVRLYWENVPVKFLPTTVQYPKNGVSHFDLWRDNVRITRMHTLLVLGMLWRSPRLFGRKICRARPGLSHWANTEERGTFAALYLVTRIYRLFGRKALQALLFPVILWFYLGSGRARQASRSFLDRVQAATQADAATTTASALSSFRHFINFGDAIIDKIAAWSGEYLREDVVFEQRALLHQCRASGSGALIFTAHLGNPEMCRALVQNAHDLKINVLVHTDNASKINSALQSINPDYNITLITISDIHPGTIALLDKKIQDGEFVVIAADRTAANNADSCVQANFFSEPAPFPIGPYVLASLLKCPVFLLFCLKQKRHTIHLEPFAKQITLPRKNRAAAIKPWVEQFASRLEYYCRLAPQQWFNFYDFWQQADKLQQQTRATAKT